VCCSVMEVVEAMRRMRLCILEVVEGRIGLLEVEVMEVMHCMLLCMLEAGLGFPEMMEAMRRVLLCDGDDATCAAL